MPTESDNLLGDLYQIKSSYFCAALIAENSVVVRAAPIIKYMIGWNTVKVQSYCKRKTFNLSHIQGVNNMTDLQNETDLLTLAQFDVLTPEEKELYIAEHSLVFQDADDVGHDVQPL